MYQRAAATSQIQMVKRYPAKGDSTPLRMGSHGPSLLAFVQLLWQKQLVWCVFVRVVDD